MSVKLSDFPRKHLGKVAEVSGMTLEEGPWITVGEAFTITGVRSGVLARWEEEGVISVLQRSEGAPRLFLKPEMETVVELGGGLPPNLRTVRRYVQAHAGSSRYRKLRKRKPTSTQPRQVPETDDAAAAEASDALANMLRGQGFTVEQVDEHRVRVTKGDSRAVEIACRRRAGDGNRLWFAWGGTIWMCESDQVSDACLLVGAASRRVGAGR